MSERPANERPASVLARYGSRPALGLSLALLLLLIAAAAARSHRDLERARERERELEAKISDTRARIGELDEEIERLRDDPVTLERLAREELGMARPDDVVLVLPEEGAAEESAAP
jgi:cell division protein FtsB